MEAVDAHRLRLRRPRPVRRPDRQPSALPVPVVDPRPGHYRVVASPCRAMASEGTKRRLAVRADAGAGDVRPVSRRGGALRAAARLRRRTRRGTASAPSPSPSPSYSSPRANCSPPSTASATATCPRRCATTAGPRHPTTLTSPTTSTGSSTGRPIGHELPTVTDTFVVRAGKWIAGNGKANSSPLPRCRTSPRTSNRRREVRWLIPPRVRRRICAPETCPSTATVACGLWAVQ